MDQGILPFLQDLGSNKMFVGFTMLLMNMGSRHVIADISQAQQNLLATEVMKKFIVFCMFFVPTRDIVVSVMLTFAFFFVTENILNEGKTFNVLPIASSENEKEAFTQHTNDAYAHYTSIVQRRVQSA